MTDVLVHPDAIVAIIMRAVRDLEHSGRRVNYQSLADYLGMPVSLVRQLVSMPVADMSEREVTA